LPYCETSGPALLVRTKKGLNLIACVVILCLPGCAVNQETDLSEIEAGEPSFGSYFEKRVDVFGIPVHATANAPDAKVLHAAGVLAQYLDNGEDGSPDDPYLLETLL